MYMYMYMYVPYDCPIFSYPFPEMDLLPISQGARILGARALQISMNVRRAQRRSGGIGEVNGLGNHRSQYEELKHQWGGTGYGAPSR